jgi:hypothetical protein
MPEIAKGGCTTLVAIFVVVALFMRPLIPMGLVFGLMGIMLSLSLYFSAARHRATAATIFQASITLAFLSTMGIIFLDTSASDDDVDTTVVAESNQVEICTTAVSSATNDDYGMGAALNGQYEHSDVVVQSDGTSTVSIVRSRSNVGGRCKSRLVGSCVMRGTDIVSKSDLREDGYFPC